MKHIKKFENFSTTNEEIDWKSLAQKIGLIKDPIKRKQETIKAIESHPAKNKVYEDWLKKDKKIADKYIEFWMKNPGAAYCKWNAEKNMFVDSGISKDSTGLLGTKSYESKKVNKNLKRSRV